MALHLIQILNSLNFRSSLYCGLKNIYSSSTVPLYVSSSTKCIAACVLTLKVCRAIFTMVRLKKEKKRTDKLKAKVSMTGAAIL